MPFTVSTEQLLVPFSNGMYNLHVRSFDPVEPHAALICFHSFAGNGRDFEALATYLAVRGCAVVCPDMFGRGSSAFFPTPANYNVRRITQGAAAVLSRYRERPIHLLGAGWGGVIGLLAAGLVKPSIAGAIFCDLPMTYVVDEDLSIRRAWSDEGLEFASLEEILNHISTSPEFAGYGGSLESLSHRVRHEGTSFGLHYDSRIVDGPKHHSGKGLDVRTLLTEVPAKVLLAYGTNSQPADFQALSSGSVPRSLRLFNGSSPVAFRRPAELKMVSDFILQDVGL